MKFEIYCDGSSRDNGRTNSVGAWAYIILLDGTKITENWGTELGATNQKMELTAAKEAFCALLLMDFQSFDEVYVYTDSSYLQQCCSQKWYLKWLGNGWLNAKKEPVANKELWEELIPHFENPNMHFLKVKGHSNGNTTQEKWNCYVDGLAQTASQKLKLEVM